METLTGTIFDQLGPRPKMAELVDWKLLALDKSARHIRIGYTAQKLFANPLGFAHGGFIVAMLDETMGATVIGVTDAEYFSTTISMSVDFLRPVPLGSLIAEGRITKLGKQIVFLESVLTDEAGKKFARATASYKLIAFDISAIQNNMQM